MGTVAYETDISRKQASDTARDDSGLDIMIVVGDDTVDLRGLRQSVHLEISSTFGLPCDVLIEHESAFAQRNSFSLEHTWFSE